MARFCTLVAKRHTGEASWNTLDVASGFKSCFFPWTLHCQNSDAGGYRADIVILSDAAACPDGQCRRHLTEYSLCGSTRVEVAAVKEQAGWGGVLSSYDEKERIIVR